MTSVEHARLDVDHAAVRSRPRRHGRRARRAGRHQRLAGRAPAQPAQPPQLPQGQPRRLADPDPLAHLEDAAARRRCSTPPTACWPRRSRRSTASARSSSAAGSSRRCACRSIRRRWPGTGLSLEDVRTALGRRRRPTSPRGRSTGAQHHLQHRGHRSAARRRRLPARWSSPTRTAPPSAWATSPTSSTTSRTTGWPAGSTASAASS